ncbi:MAG: discoidin domain-containing protein [Planctomycetota bacterium]|jgi:hypothetical protein
MKCFVWTCLCLAISLVALSNSSSAAEFTPLTPTQAPQVIGCAEAFPGMGAELLVDGSSLAYASNDKGTETFVDFDLGRPTRIGGFKHVDRSDPATVDTAQLVFSDRNDFSELIRTIEVDHVNTPGGTTFARFKPVTARYVRWQVTSIPQYACSGGTEITFFSTADSEPTPKRTSFNAHTWPALIRGDGQLLLPLLVTINYPYAESTEATLEVVGNPPRTLSLQTGTQTVELSVPAAKTEKSVDLTLTVSGKTVAKGQAVLRPVRRWEIHIVHQTHLDIGFTHTQEDVLQLQVAHLKTALKYIDRTKDYPPDSQFKWHPEGMWAVEEFLRTASDDERTRFIEACHKGLIHIDALYAQAMTGMYTEEELFELVGAAKRFEKTYGVAVISAMQSDVPGYTWGLATVLAHNEIPYLSVGPNWFAIGDGSDYFKGVNIVGRTHRGGLVFHWADNPFWWVDPSGKHKVLFWMPGWGYSGFHIDRSAITEEKVFSYLDHLQDKGYLYDMVMWRYAIGADNGPPSDQISDIVKAWNEKYASPRLILTNNSTVMKTFAERYGDKLPVVRGDFTPYWEDGCASTSKATGVNRRACEKIAQTQILWAMLNPKLKLHKRFDMAWHKMLMYDEHTWGANNSISAPDETFAVQQDRYKQAYAFDGSKLTDALLDDVTEALCRTGSETIDVYNTASWTRSGLVLISSRQSMVGNLVKNDQDKEIPSQRLASGQLAFVAQNVPSLGARRFTIHVGDGQRAGSARAADLKLANGLLTMEIEGRTGAIRSLRHKDIAKDLVDRTQANGLNDYLYILGRDAAKNNQHIRGPVKVTVEDPGPLVATLCIESDAPGCAKLIRRVRVVDGFDYVELINTTDKLKERNPEGVYFGFPLNIPGAVSRIDVPWAVVQVDKDQIHGANRNFYCVQRWVDLSNEDYGVTWVTVDAPMLQYDPIKIALPFGGQYWRKRFKPGAHIYSWAMNNHWECNYKAYQKGEITFRYVLWPHARGYDSVRAQRFGRGVCQPLLVVQADPEKPVTEPLLKLEGEGVVVTSIRPSRDGKALMVRLFNTADSERQVKLHWNRPVGVTWLSNPMEETKVKISAAKKLNKFEVVTLRVEQYEK